MAAPAHHAHPTRTRGDAAENYAKTIYELQSRSEGAVGTNAIAERLGVSPGSASAMIKRLAEDGLVERTPYRGVRLTKRGEQVALGVIRHHRLLELFLAEILEVPWDRVHEEAEVLEHHISEELTERIARKLGYPTRDPHGDPIPSDALELEEEATVSLQGMAEGEKGTFVRVSDSDPEMLRYLSERGIAPGDRFQVVERQPFDGPLTLRFDRSEVTLGGDLARAMRVEV
jgi:DtxR family transcriptional regulator, Mn-dependent transcriptional regulator